MKLQLDHEIYKWLISLKILSQDPKHRLLASGKYELDEKTTRLFENGLKFAELINSLWPILADPSQISSPKALQALKDQNTPATRLYNWNILYEILKQMGISLDPEIKSLIVKGDLPMINEFLKDVYESVSVRLERLSATSSAKSNISTRNYQFKLTSQEQNLLKIPKKTLVHTLNNETDPDLITIEQISRELPIKDCASLLEVLLVSLTRNLDLKPKQSVALLSNGNKYLAHVLVKGMKGNYEPLTYWLQEIYTNIEHILRFLSQEDLMIPVFLQAMKPCLLSKCPEICSWGCRIISNVCYELANSEMLAPAWQWFCKENGGFYACFLCLKRNPYMREGVASVIAQIARFNLSELLTVECRKFIENTTELIDFLHNILAPLAQSAAIKEGLLKENVIDCWLDLLFKSLETSNDCKTNSLGLLTDIWLQFPGYIEETEGVAGNILSVLKKGTRDKSPTVQRFSIVLLFRLLETFGKSKNAYAPILYKTLTFSYIENHDDLSLRELYSRNFEEILVNFPSIPVDILADPLIKQLHVSESRSFFVNLFDFDLLFLISKHPKLQIKMAVFLLDLLIKLYLNSLIWSPLCRRIIANLLDRFTGFPAFSQYLCRMAEVLLETFRTSEKKRKFVAAKRNPLVFSEENEVEIQNAQQRALIIQLLREILQRNSEEFRQFLTKPLLSLHLNIKQTRKSEHQGVVSLLKLLGNPQNQENPEPIAAKLEEKAVQIDFVKENPEKLQENATKIEKIDNFSRNVADVSHFSRNFSVNADKTEDFSMEAEQLFMDKHQIGVKVKETSRNPAKTRGNQRAFEDLQRLRVKKLEDALKKQLEDEEKRIKDEITRKTIRKALENQGVFKKTPGFQENSGVLPENVAKTEKTPVFFVDFAQEEQKDQEIVEIWLKKADKLLKNVFRKYSSAKVQGFFSEMQEKSEVLSGNELWRLLKDVNLDAFCGKTQVFQLIRLINARFPRKNDANSVDFEGFREFFAQFAANFLRNDLEALLRLVSKRNSEFPSVFEEKVDKETAELDELLRKEPSTELPEGYKKVQEKIIEVEYRFPETLSRQIGEKYAFCFEIVNFLVEKAAKTQLFEPLTQILTVTKARKTRKREISLRKVKEKRGNSQENRRNSQENRGNSQENQGNSQENQGKSQGNSASVVGKGQINALKRLKSRELVKEKSDKSENPLEKLPKAVVLRSQSHESRRFSRDSKGNSWQSAEKINKLEIERRKQAELQEEKAKDAEIKRKLRQEELERELKELKLKKMKEDEEKAREKASFLQEKEASEQREREKKQKRLEDNKRKLREFKEKQEIERERLAQQQKSSIERQQEAKKKENDEFLRKQAEKLNKVFEEKKKERDTQSLKRQEISQTEKLKETERKKQVAQLLEKERKKREKHRDFREKVKQVLQKPEIQAVFKRFHEEISHVFEYYRENDAFALKNLMTFAVEFQLCPQVLSFEGIQRLFREISSENPGNSLDFAEFCHILLRIAAKGQKAFDLLTKTPQNREIFEEFAGSVDKKLRKSEEFKGIEAISEATLEGLMSYLDFPMEKAQLNNKFRDLKNKREKVQPPRDKRKAFVEKIVEKKRGKSEDGEELRRNKGDSMKKKENYENSRENLEEIQEVALEELRKDEYKSKSVKVLGPQGKEEKWDVLKDKN